MVYLQGWWPRRHRPSELDGPANAPAGAHSRSPSYRQPALPVQRHADALVMGAIPIGFQSMTLQGLLDFAGDAERYSLVLLGRSIVEVDPAAFDRRLRVLLMVESVSAHLDPGGARLLHLFADRRQPTGAAAPEVLAGHDPFGFQLFERP